MFVLDKVNPFKKLMNWYFSKKALPYWCILILDFLILMFAGILTYWIFIYRRKIGFDQSMLLQTLFMYALPSITLVSSAILRLWI